MTLVTSAPAPIRSSVTADPIAGVLLLLAGTAGMLELLLPWKRASPLLAGDATGWKLFEISRNQSLPAGDTLALYSLLGVAVAGGACVLLGLAMFAPIDHHPLGAIALLLSVLSIGGAVWYVLRTRSAVGGVAAIFEQGQVGFYLFLAAGVLGLVGAIKALATP